MARVLVTGSKTGLGKAAAQQLLDDGHDVVLHARNPTRIAGLEQPARRAAGVVIGDLADAGETRDLTDQANALGGIDAVIHNADVYTTPSTTPKATSTGPPSSTSSPRMAPVRTRVCRHCCRRCWTSRRDRVR